MHETFPTVFGRGLVGELKNFVHAPFLVATMEDLWPQFAPEFEGSDAVPWLVRSMDLADLEAGVRALPKIEAVVGLGGGQALDAAKYIAWRRRVPLFQVPTALSSNAMFGHRSGVRHDGQVRHLGWAVPEAVYIDYEVIRAAPPKFNYSGIGEVLSFHTAALDWAYAQERGRCEERWPYDEDLAALSLERVEHLIANQNAIRDLTDTGIGTLVRGLQWGSSFHTAGWNPRHLEGIDHSLLYALEAKTGRTFLHGQPVCLGVVAGSMLHDCRTEEIMRCIANIGLDIRPAAMGLSWDEVFAALKGLPRFVEEAGLWYGIAHDLEPTEDELGALRELVEGAYSSADDAAPKS